MRRFAAFAFGVVLLALSTSARAHAIGLSRGDYRVTARGLDVAIVLARGEAAALDPSLDVRGGPSTAESPIASALDAQLRATIEKIRVTGSRGACPGTFDDVRPTEQDGIELRAHYLCPQGSERLAVTFDLLGDLSHGHRHAAHVIAAITTDYLLYRDHATFAIEPDASPLASTIANVNSAARVRWTGFLRMGIEHILGGADHLLFLLALVLAGGGARSLALAVTSFTVAHSLTLGAAVLGFVTPPAAWIEPAIALSVACVGVESFFRRHRAGPWITFAFGLVHGFGFAGALANVAMARDEVPWALLSFNAGVEIGQLAWMLVAAIALAQLRRLEPLARRAVPLLSAVIVVVGLGWFVERLRDGGVDKRGVACASARCG